MKLYFQESFNIDFCFWLGFLEFHVDFAVADVSYRLEKPPKCRFPSAAPRAREIYDEVGETQ